MLDNVFGWWSPSVRRHPSSDSRQRGSASARWPWALSNSAKLLMLVSVSGWRLPSVWRCWASCSNWCCAIPRLHLLLIGDTVWAEIAHRLDSQLAPLLSHRIIILLSLWHFASRCDLSFVAVALIPWWSADSVCWSRGEESWHFYLIDITLIIISNSYSILPEVSCDDAQGLCSLCSAHPDNYCCICYK